MTTRLRGRGKRAAITIVGVLFLGVVVAALFAPYVDRELAVWLEPHAIVDSAPAQLAKGRMVDDYFAVEDLGDGTFAIGEPRYYQQNYSYLIVGRNAGGSVRFWLGYPGYQWRGRGSDETTSHGHRVAPAL